MTHKDAIYNNIDNIPKNWFILVGIGFDDGGKSFGEEATINWTLREELSVLSQKFGHMLVIQLCLMGPNSPLIVCSPFIAYHSGDGLLNSFSLPAGRMLSFVNSGCWRNTAKGKGFCFLVPGCLLNRCSHSFPSTQLL